MKYDFEIRNKKAIYLNNSQFLSEAFDNAFMFNNFIIAYNCKKLVIVNCNDDTVFSKNGQVLQVYNGGEYISLLDTHNRMGVLRYDSTIVVPFNFYQTLISSEGFEVRETSDSKWCYYDINGK